MYNPGAFSMYNPGAFSMYNPWEYEWSFPANNENPEASDRLDKFFRLAQVTLNLEYITRNLPRPRYEQPITPIPPIPPITPIPQWNNFDGILGFKAKACKKCLTIACLPILRGQIDVMSNVEHHCSQDRINEIQCYETDQRNNLASNIEKIVPESLLRACKEWAKDAVYLRAFPTNVDHPSGPRIDIVNIDKENWLIRTINNSQTSVSDVELLEFLRMAKDQTCTFVYIKNSSDATYNSCYLIAVIRNLSQ